LRIKLYHKINIHLEIYTFTKQFNIFKIFISFIKLSSLDINILQNYVNNIFKRLGATSSAVTIIPTIYLSTSTIGFNPNIIGLPVRGTIYVNLNELAYFSDIEILFILGHECIHIYNNHIWARTGWTIIEDFFSGLDAKKIGTVDVIKTLYSLINGLVNNTFLTPREETIRDQEYEADELAVKLIIGQNNLQSAINCLNKLTNYNPKLVSHEWKLYSTPIPIMTMEQRINELKNRISNPNFY
jgi:Zn-dependent protease with chaperone function